MIIPRRSINDGRQSRVSMRGAVKLTASWRARSSGSESANRVGRPSPALLIKTSSPPNREIVSASKPLGRRRVGEVGGDRQDLEARLQRLQLGGELVKPIAAAGRQHERPRLLFACQLACQRRPDAGGRAGEQNDPAGPRRSAVPPSAGIVSRSLDRFGT